MNRCLCGDCGDPEELCKCGKKIHIELPRSRVANGGVIDRLKELCAELSDMACTKKDCRRPRVCLRLYKGCPVRKWRKIKGG